MKTTAKNRASSNIPFCGAAHLRDGAVIWWDGESRLYVDLPNSYRGQVKVRSYFDQGNFKNDFAPLRIL
jgi:hypothetical protein